MSQGGGNEVARLHTTITGDVAPLAAATKQAEQIVQQSAAKIEATTAATAQSVQQMGSGGAGAGGGVSPGFGVFGGNNFGSPVIEKNRSIIASLHEKSRAIGRVIGLWTRFVGVVGLVVGAGAGLIALLDKMGRKGYDTAAGIKETNKSIEGMFAQFKKGESSDNPAIQKIEEEAELAVAKQEALAKISDLRNEARYKEAAEAEKKMNEEVASSKDAIEQRFRDRMDRRTDESRKKDKEDRAKREYEVGKASADAVGGVLGAYAEADAEIALAQKTLTNEALDHKLQLIQIELDTKLAAIGTEEKEQQKAFKRTMDDRRRQMQEFWRDVRGDQVSGFAVEGFQTSNLSQSLDLLARQRGGVDGPQQLRVDYGGTR